MFFPLGHQVTQEEVLICPSHAAVLANYSDLMCALAGICGDARCSCINPPAPSSHCGFCNIKQTAFLGRAVFLFRGNLTALAQDVTQHGQWGCFLLCLCLCMRECVRQLQSTTLLFQPFTHILLFTVKPERLQSGWTAASWCNLSVST